MSDLADGPRAFVVTGAAHGIGRSCALELAARGADVVLADLDEDAATQVAVQASAYGGRAVPVRADVTDPDACATMVGQALVELGRIDGAVLSAGVARHRPLLEMTPDEWRSMLDVHLSGAFHALTALARPMRERGGAIVYVGSTVAHGGGPLHQAHYVAAKAGAEGLVRAAAREFGRYSITVNAIAAGFTDTGMNTGLFTDDELTERAARSALGRIAEPADIARVSAFLLGPDARFVTGHTLAVDGGARLG